MQGGFGWLKALVSLKEFESWEVLVADYLLVFLAYLSLVIDLPNNCNTL